MKLCRLDTYEVISEREMTDEEKNGNLFAPIDETKGPKSETKPEENETIAPPETEQTSEEDPSGLPPMTEEIAEQVENNFGDENPPWKDSQPQAEPEPIAKPGRSRRKAQK